MSTLITNNARAYVNWGRWIADCPVNCGGALALAPGQTMFACQECGTFSQIEWPANSDEIWEELSRRAAPKFRNWFPAGHELAVRAGLPHGQSVDDLKEEAHENDPTRQAEAEGYTLAHDDGIG